MKESGGKSVWEILLAFFFGGDVLLFMAHAFVARILEAVLGEDVYYQLSNYLLLDPNNPAIPLYLKLAFTFRLIVCIGLAVFSVCAGVFFPVLGICLCFGYFSLHTSKETSLEYIKGHPIDFLVWFFGICFGLITVCVIATNWNDEPAYECWFLILGGGFAAFGLYDNGEKRKTNSRSIARYCYLASHFCAGITIAGALYYCFVLLFWSLLGVHVYSLANGEVPILTEYLWNGFEKK